MTKSHAPSTKPVSRGQAGKFFDKLWHKLDALGLKGQAWNQAFEAHGDKIIAECTAVVQKYVDMMSSIVVHWIDVDRTRPPTQVIAETGRRQYVDADVVATMPRGTGDTAKLVFFKPAQSAYKNGLLMCAVLADEYKRRGLKPDAEALADYNKKNPEAADKEPNACQWVDADGKYCHATFLRWFDVRRVHVRRRDGAWDGDRLFASVPDESSASAV